MTYILSFALHHYNFQCLALHLSFGYANTETTVGIQIADGKILEQDILLMINI